MSLILHFNAVQHKITVFPFRALIGELDEDLDSQIDLNTVRAAPLKPVLH